MNSILPGSGEYHYVDGKSSKFWRCEPLMSNEPYGNYRITWGRIGTQGQMQEIPREDAAKRLREKVSKGYELVEGYVENVHKRKQREAQERVAKKREERQHSSAFLEELFKIS